MALSKPFSDIHQIITLLSCLLCTVTVSAIPATHSPSFYATAHSLGDSYTFEAHDGWTSVNVSNSLSYNTPPCSPTSLVPRSKHSKEHGKGKQGKKSKLHEHNVTSKTKSLSNLHSEDISVSGAVSGVKNALKATGKSEEVTITWYTGNDLRNPSCWSENVWTPTDESFICALTQEGWISKPECFKFLELCNGPRKCVFVRVVDTCQGCAPGSKHVDLTKAAFSALADLDKGTTIVQMRPATYPVGWLENLWGPEVKL
ncbi:secreted protein [Moniliophthora roreri MCA 2997]|uniref:Secreted protein n=1 Tax=Moniliophthora roreri (strain MCA 2997) TaxID=1381753 RepID=V2XV79_MONRO|nr:secreted protein [Moniliophthora roreri MCA 2997]KAI3612572.1 secreted protein [Moniliophthora roreri]